MSQITVYQKPTCSTCKKVYEALQNAGVDFETVDYYIDPISEEKLKELVKKTGESATALFRKRDLYKELELEDKEISDDDAIKMMVENPDLLQRPIIEKGDKAILARPAERVQEIL